MSIERRCDVCWTTTIIHRDELPKEWLRIVISERAFLDNGGMNENTKELCTGCKIKFYHFLDEQSRSSRLARAKPSTATQTGTEPATSTS